jgi:muramoyltetrapeptide carboxypeptidase
MSLSRKSFLSISFFSAGSILIGKGWKSEKSISPSIIKPKRLPETATLGLVAPASPIYAPADFDRMINSLTELGYNLVIGDHVRDRSGYLAGSDVDRVSDLHAMFSDKTIDGILCTRGGYGSNRILELIDFDVIANNPKPFIGFSDITSLHLAIYKHTGLVTFHGPVGKSDWNEYTVESWNSILHKTEKPLYEVPEDQEDSFIISSGTSSGKLLGGNLTVLTSLLGSDFLPSFEDSILFLEDVGEDVYRVDRMFSQLQLSGILDQINGLVFGKCTNCSESSNSLSLKEVLDHYISPLNIPAFYGAMISHEEQNLTIPVGIQATIDADKKTIKILESAVL